MTAVPEIFMFLHESLLYSYFPSSSAFGEEKAKVRSLGLVLVSLCPQSQMQYFDVASKEWKLLEAPATEAVECYCAESVGSKLYVAGIVSGSHCICCYDIDINTWEKRLPHSSGKIEQLCSVGDHMYAVGSCWNQVPQRYNFAEQQWQSFAKAGITGSHNFNSGAAVFNSKLFVLYGKASYVTYWSMSSAVLFCFDPSRNVWEEKASTSQPHFGSSLFAVNNRLYVAGGFNCTDTNGRPYGNFASVEVYDEENNKWSVVDQKPLPPNNLGAVEIEGKVYFIVNRFPIDSGIRIPPEELYPVCLDKWEALGNIAKNAVLCYAPLKKETLKKD